MFNFLKNYDETIEVDKDFLSKMKPSEAMQLMIKMLESRKSRFIKLKKIGKILKYVFWLLLVLNIFTFTRNLNESASNVTIYFNTAIMCLNCFFICYYIKEEEIIDILCTDIKMQINILTERLTYAEKLEEEEMENNANEKS